MGKPKIKSSIKALHQAFFNFIPPGPKTMTWVCIQQAKTQSFREAYNSFNSMYYSASSSSSSSSSSSTSTYLCSSNEETERNLPSNMLSIQMVGAAEESSLASSSSSTEVDETPSFDSVQKLPINSKRFFFSPCTTNSIMEEAHIVLEAKDEMGISENAFSGDRWLEIEGGGEKEGGDCMMKEVDFWKESVTMPLASMNPYMDFKVSMEAMVEAHGLKDWSCLMELLNCYLQLNDQTNHKTIVWAFVDLLVNLTAEEKDNSKSNSSNPSKESRFSLLCLDS